MKRKEKKEAKQGRLKIRVVLTAGAVGLLGAACSPIAPSPANSPCQGECGVITNLDGGHDGGVDAGPDAGEGRDGGDGG